MATIAHPPGQELRRGVSVSQCTKCGTNFVGTPEQPPAPGLCKWCEIEHLKAVNFKLRTALVRLVGAETKDELEAMEFFIKAVASNSDDQAAALHAILVLIETA
jgi:hypothetical protein